MSENLELDDDFFKAYSKKVKEESDSKGGTSSYPQPEYEDIGYVGCAKGTFSIVRLIGAPVDACKMGYKRKPTDPIEIMTCEVKDDEGKRFTIRMPLRQPVAADNHILIRLYDKVMKKERINGKSVLVNENKPQYKEIFDMVSKGGFKPEDGRTYQYSSGYKGDVVSIYNVIDRSDDWCKKNKHTKILCRDLNVDDQGRVWAKPGIKSYGSIQKIAAIIGKYGSFEKYDLGFKRTGLKDSPWEIVNASRLKEAEMTEDLVNDDGSEVDVSTIMTGPLTDEELAYENYNLDKFFAPTTYHKLQKRIGNLFKLCDAQMGTHFTEELAGLVEKEKAEWDAAAAQKEAAQEVKENEEIRAAASSEEPEEAAPAPRRRAAAPASEGLTEEKIALLKGWERLSDEIKARVKDVVMNEAGKPEIVWDRKDDLLQCDACGALSPEEGVTHCPVCGAKF